MCRRVTCKKCNKPSWAGCGAHVEQVLGDVPRAQRCQCSSGGSAPKATSTKSATGKQSLLGRLLGR